MSAQPIPLRPPARLAHLEPWLDKPAAAHFWRVSERWLEYRMDEGMPHALIGGRIKFRPSVVEPWMRENGHLELKGQT